MAQTFLDISLISSTYEDKIFYQQLKFFNYATNLKKSDSYNPEKSLDSFYFISINALSLKNFQL